MSRFQLHAFLVIANLIFLSCGRSVIAAEQKTIEGSRAMGVEIEAARDQHHQTAAKQEPAFSFQAGFTQNLFDGSV